MARKAKQYNIKDLAREAGVSISTVSRVLNNHTDVSENLRRKVQEVIDLHKFTPDKAIERTLRINVIVGVGDITDYISNILTGIYWMAEQESVEIAIQRCCTDRISLLRCCRNWRSDAVILISADLLMPQVNDLVKAGIPCMIIDRHCDNPAVGSVCGDWNFTGQQLLRHLHSLGHSKIALLTTDPIVIRGQQKRLDVYRKFMSSIGEDENALLMPPYPPEHIDGIGREKQIGYQQTLQLLQEHPEVTAITCLSDEVAMGCYKACHDFGKRIPEDISVAGFHDESFAQYMNPPLTTIRLQLAKSGRLAVEYLKKYATGKLERLPQVMLPSELMIRGSIAPKKQ